MNFLAPLRVITLVTFIGVTATAHAEGLFLCGNSYFSNVAGDGCHPIDPPPLQRENPVMGNTGVVPLNDAPLGLPEAKKNSASSLSDFVPVGIGNSNATSGVNPTHTIGQLEAVLKAVSDCLGSVSVDENARASSACLQLQNLEQMIK